jgi:hypothetical protein
VTRLEEVLCVAGRKSCCQEMRGDGRPDQ